MTLRWKTVGELFDQALATPPDQRDAFLKASGTPPDIQDEVRALLAAHEAAGDFLESPQHLAPREALPIAAGTTIGAYRVIRTAGRGGMGIVYEAEDTRLHRRVAMKALSPDVAHDEVRRRRLRHEARAAAALQHPGIATIYALEEMDGHLFIVSEFLEGETLRDELARGPLGPERATTCAIEVVEALCVAHERGVVHRDLKPENIIRTADGTLKILDFGVAQFDPPETELAPRSRLTLAGMLAGTPAYMAPEQLLGAPTDFRTDHFALGIVIYELCTGKHPFAAESLPSTIARILAAAPDAVAPLDAAAPPWHVIDRCLQKEPAQRFASTRDLLSALETAAAALSAGGAPSSARASLGGERRTHRNGLRHNDGAYADAPATVEATAGHDAGRVTWWRFHQFAAAMAYWAMVWPVWHVHRALGRAGLFFFFAALAAVVIAANLRLHLWFSSRVYPEDLAARQAEVSRWIRWADVAFATLLIGGGIALPDDRAGWAALLISFGVGAAVIFTFVEPATTRAAFRQLYPDRQR